MSAEQAEGVPPHDGSDVFSPGCVLYEMLTDRQAFHADSAAEILAAVLMREADVAQLPLSVIDALRRAVEKRLRRCWQAVGDLRAELEAVLRVEN